MLHASASLYVAMCPHFNMAQLSYTLFCRSGKHLVFVRLAQTHFMKHAPHLGGILSKARCCIDVRSTESHAFDSTDRQWLDLQGKGSSNEAAAAGSAAQTQSMSAYQTQSIQSAGPGQGYSTGVAPGQGQGQYGAGQGYGSGAALGQGGVSKSYQ